MSYQYLTFTPAVSIALMTAGYLTERALLSITLRQSFHWALIYATIYGLILLLVAELWRFGDGTGEITSPSCRAASLAAVTPCFVALLSERLVLRALHSHLVRRLRSGLRSGARYRRARPALTGYGVGTASAASRTLPVQLRKDAPKSPPRHDWGRAKFAGGGGNRVYRQR